MDFPIVNAVAPIFAILGVLGISAWVFTTWLRIKHGYPLDGAWGQAIYPKNSDETIERVKLLSTEMRSFGPSSARSRTGSPPSRG